MTTWTEQARIMLIEARQARGSKFLYLPKRVSAASLAKLLYQEYAHPSRADERLLQLMLAELVALGLLIEKSIQYSAFSLGHVTFHDVYLHTTDGGRYCRGTSTDYMEAAAKALGELFERTALKYPDVVPVTVASQEDLAKKRAAFVSTRTWAQPTEAQQDAFPNCCIDERDGFSWVAARSLTDGTPYLVPAQAVFFGNQYAHSNEKDIVQQTTHGAGAGHTSEAALRSAICEITHRHFFLAAWYRNEAVEKIDPDTIPEREPITIVLRDLRAAGFVVHLLDYSTAAKLPTVVCAIEKFGGLSIGASTAYTMQGAIERAVMEAVSTYLWSMQATIHGGNHVEQETINGVRHDFLDAEHGTASDRVLHYNSGAFVATLDVQFLRGAMKPFTTRYDVPTDFDIVAYAVRTFGDVYVYESTKPYLADYGYHAVRAIVPNSYPFALTETFSRPVLGGKNPQHMALCPFP